ncbi:MAG: Ig-like domain-containing protein [Myxococcaceae bacterium]|nr:Ig-like domain-containing protein [Myxococcaceae bacterium]
MLLRLGALLLLAACSGSPLIPSGGPRVVSTTPAAQSTDVSPTTSFIVEFSTVMDKATVKLTLTPLVELDLGTWNGAGTVVTFTAAQPLRSGVSFTGKIAGSDPQLRVLQGDPTLAFTTAEPRENTWPTVELGDAGLTLVFSERMASDSVFLSSTPDRPWGEPTWSSGDTVATFVAPPAAGAYQLTVSGDDLAGNALPSDPLSFTVPDVTPLQVVGASPGVHPAVSFSKSLHPSSAAALSVSPDAGCTPRVDGALLACAREGPLPPSTTFTVAVSTLARDLAMNPLAAPFSFTFTTPAAPDVTAPRVLSRSPADAGTGLARSTPIVVGFDEPMDRLSTQAALTVLSPPGRPLVYSWDDAGTHVTATAAFEHGDAVTWALGPGALDLAGQALDAGITHTFTVRKLCTGAELRSDSSRTGTVSRSTSFLYEPTGTRVRVGRESDASSDTVSRGLFVFPFGKAGSTCSATGVAGTALEVKQATLRVRQVAVTGAPFALGRGALELDWLPYALSNDDANVVFEGASPCTLPACRRTLATTAAIVERRLDVTSLVREAMRARTGAGDLLTLRVWNPYTEGLSTRSADWVELDDEAVIDVTYELP